MNKIKIFLSVILFLDISLIDCLGGGHFSKSVKCDYNESFKSENEEEVDLDAATVQDENEEYDEHIERDVDENIIFSELKKHWVSYPIHKKFEVVNTLKETMDGKKLFNNKNNIIKLFNYLELQTSLSKIEFYAVFGVVEELEVLLNFTPNKEEDFSLKTLIDYAREFKLNEIVDKLEEYKDAIG